MPTEIEIKEEIMTALPDDNARKKCEPEIDKWAATDNLDGKPILQKFYSQWKSGKKGHQNRVNSWTAYYLGVTTKKPTVEFQGEKFLDGSVCFHPKRRAFARPSPPDIDSDFDYDRRHEVMDYIVNRYGRYNVGNIGTYGALKMRSCLTRIIKTLDIANAFDKGKDQYISKNVEQVDEILGNLPKRRNAAGLLVHDNEGEELILKTTKDVVEADSKECDDFRFYMEKYPDIYRAANQIEGLLSIFSCVSDDTPILTKSGWVRIDQLDESCEIAYLDHNGKIQFTKKFDSWNTGKKECYRLRLENGNFVDLTDDHLVNTDKGYIALKEIIKNPQLYKVLSYIS